MLSALLASAVLAASPAVGEVAPDFSVKDADGNALQLSQLVREHTVLLVFFPKAFTPG
jgi:peroxiredoxin